MEIGGETRTTWMRAPLRLDEKSQVILVLDRKTDLAVPYNVFPIAQDGTVGISNFVVTGRYDPQKRPDERITIDADALTRLIRLEAA